MVELKIDPEFRDALRKQTQEEYEQLKANILTDGEAYRPIMTWQGYIIDGHHRWKIIQENPQIKFRTIEKDFPNKHAVLAWIYKNQLDSQDGQRLVSHEERTYMMGKRNEEEKLAHGGDRKSKSTLDLEPKGRTGQKIADEYNVGYGTVLRAEQFAKGVDSLREVSPDAADKILSGDSGVTQSTVREVPNMTDNEKKQFADDVVSGEVKKHNYKPVIANKKPRPRKSEEDLHREEVAAKMIEAQYDKERVVEYTLDDLLSEIKRNGEDYTSSLRMTLTLRSTILIPENRESVANEIEAIITEIKKIKELVK